MRQKQEEREEAKSRSISYDHRILGKDLFLYERKQAGLRRKEAHEKGKKKKAGEKRRSEERGEAETSLQ